MGSFLYRIKNASLFTPACKNKGFTLVELLIVIAILGILAGIAVPLFLGERSKAMHAEAKSNLETLRLLEEQYFAENGVYAVTAAGTACTSYPCNLTYKDTTGSIDGGIEDLLPGFRPGAVNSLKFTYTLAITNNGANFTATATGKDGTPVKDTTFTIDQNNNRNF